MNEHAGKQLKASTFGDESVLPHPSGLVEILFERMPMGIAVFDQDLRLCRFNPTWHEYVSRYGPVHAPIEPGAYYFDLMKGLEAQVMPLFERVLHGEALHFEAFPLSAGEITSYWDVVLAPLTEDGDVVGILNVTTDVTERVLAKDALAESQRMLSTLISNLPGMAYRCRIEEDWTMEFVSEGCLALTGYLSSELMENQVISYGTLIHPEDRDAVWTAIQDALKTHQPFQLIYRIIAAEGERDAPKAGHARDLKEPALSLSKGPSQPGRRRMKWVWEQGRGVYSETGEALALEGFITDISERMGARHALEQRVQARTREIERRRIVAESLWDILRVLNSNHPLDEILDYIAEQARQLLDTSAVAIYRLHDEEGLLKIEAAQGLSKRYVQNTQLALGQGALGRAVVEGEPVVIPDVGEVFTDDSAYVTSQDGKEVLVDPALRQALAQAADRYGAVVGVPLFVRGQIYGGLALYYPTSRTFTKEEIDLASTLADHIALAIENARLRLQLEHAAVTAERNRLARELHDSVSQALYGIGLGARTARTLLDREALEEEVKAKLINPLDYVLSLADAGLAEMRALIFELRPEALAQEGLAAALNRQAKALRARHKLDVQCEICEEPELPLESKESLYRIAQEALNNIVKHAQASQVCIRLADCEDSITLEIQDDGNGFDPQGDYPGHMGLQSMQERAVRLGSALEVESEPGQGATIRVRLQN